MKESLRAAIALENRKLVDATRHANSIPVMLYTCEFRSSIFVAVEHYMYIHLTSTWPFTQGDQRVLSLSVPAINGCVNQGIMCRTQ